MINKLTKIFINKTSWKKVLLLLVPTLTVYVSMLMYSIPKVTEHTNGMKF